jgi:hypothetical protein
LFSSEVGPVFHAIEAVLLPDKCYEQMKQDDSERDEENGRAILFRPDDAAKVSIRSAGVFEDSSSMAGDPLFRRTSLHVAARQATDFICR